MLKFKKIWLVLLGIIVFFWINLQYTQWLSTRDHPNTRFSTELERDSDPKVGNELIDEKDPTWEWSKAMWDKSLWILHLPQASNYETELWYLLALIKITINWILWMLAFIVLIYLLYCGFQILSAWEDDKGVSTWRKWIKNAAIAIAWIWLAWLIISAMIWFIQLVSNAE